ncbi:hypothetical protein [Aquimarina algicola]|uniref:Uncharacterized protein n=1 Tax=Aquimarina algicola TaxID=2589995 RepID=A0A504JD20_9FLAO|nr:hypothetical protein [Aquimarina algicola]TPN84480.1 hypothetical protein FHK87_16235 [Aquimarina algicola]
MRKEQVNKNILLGISCTLAFAYSFYTIQYPKIDFHGCWIESFKNEDIKKRSIRIFKSCNDNSLAPSRRFRFKMELHKNRTCEYLSMSATDAHKMRQGIWVYDSKNRILKIKNLNNKIIKSFKVIKVKQNKLHLKTRK